MPSSRRTSRSAGVSSSVLRSAASVSRPERTCRSSSCRVILGARTGSPLAASCTARISSAGPVSLRRKPLAPARRARVTPAPSPNAVSITTQVRGERRAMSSAAAMPSRVGIWMSRRATSTSWARHAAVASRPSPASATTSMSSAFSRISRIALRRRPSASALPNASVPLTSAMAPGSFCGRTSSLRTEWARGKSAVAAPWSTRLRISSGSELVTAAMTGRDHDAQDCHQGGLLAVLVAEARAAVGRSALRPETATSET